MLGFCAIGAIGSVSSEGPRALLTIWPWLTMIAGASWALYWKPSVVVTNGGVRVVNIFRTIDVPWPALEGIDTRWALTLHTSFGTFRAWAAPAPGRQVLRRSTAIDRRVGGRPKDETARPSDLPNTDSGAAAAVVQQRWQRLRSAGHLDDAVVEFEHAPVRWHWQLLAGCVATAVLALLGLLV